MSTTAFQRFESVVVAVLLVALYAASGFGWLLFSILFLVPDVFMAGYLFGPRSGALIYNIGHSYALPIMLAATVILVHAWGVGMAIALIWASHIAVDRMFGFGFKHPSGFKDTHLGRIGG